MKKVITIIISNLLALSSCGVNESTGPDPIDPDPKSLSSSAQSWYQASPPVSSDSLWYYPPAWDLYWFSPRDQDVVNRVRSDEVFVLRDEEKKASTQSSLYKQVLRLHMTPAPKVDSLLPRYKNGWAGIMTTISPKFTDKQMSQFFEFFVKIEGGFSNKGKLRVQMGKMGEDVSLNGGPPNNRGDYEDTSAVMQKDVYDTNLDIGWDRLRDSAEVYLIPAAAPGRWDTLRYGDSRLGPDSLDPAKDNYRQYRFDIGDLENFRYDCRRAGDAKLSSEDINKDDWVLAASAAQYFQFDIDLADARSPLIDTTVDYVDTTRSTWRKYRIPLHELVKGYEGIFSKVGNPDWSNIAMVRLIWTGFDLAEPTMEQKLVLFDMRFD